MATLQIVNTLGAEAARPDIPDESDESRDLTIRKLRLVGSLRKAGVNVDITDVIATGSATDTITGAPEVIVSIWDRDYRLLKSGVFGNTVDIQIDTIPYRLVEVSLQDVEQVQLTFEHKIVALLRKHDSPLKAARDTVTRAQFIEMMLREIVPDFPGLRFVCPEINTVQPVRSSKKTGRTLKTKTLASGKSSSSGSSSRQPGFGGTWLTIRSWDGSTVHLGPQQLANAATALQVCQQDNAPAKAVLACMEACIVEAPNFNNSGVATDGTSTGILQLLASTASGLGLNALDVAAVVHAFLTKGFTGAGGAIALARANPGWSAGQIAQAVQGSAFPARYDQAQAGAVTVITAWSHNSIAFQAISASGLASIAAPSARYEFTRGQSGQAEDSWTCGQRLASEVNWRLFIAGARTVYFATDDDLLQGDTKYRLHPRSLGIVKPGFDAEVGKRTVVLHGRRQPKPSEAQFEVRVDRWHAPIGSVIELEGWGPADGQWINVETDTNLFDADATLRIQAPQKPLPEPAAAAAASGSSVNVPAAAASPALNSANAVDRVYAAATIISQRNLPYVYGGGHGSWADAASASGLDCSSAVSLALHMAGLMDRFPGPLTSGLLADQWGIAGKGSQMTVWANVGHVFIEFYGRPANRFDTVPGGSGGNGPHLRYTGVGSPSDMWEASGFTAKHWPGY